MLDGTQTEVKATDAEVQTPYCKSLIDCTLN